ncbi:hypothetical protein D3C78_18170 [compost metagenome]
MSIMFNGRETIFHGSGLPNLEIPLRPQLAIPELFGKKYDNNSLAIRHRALYQFNTLYGHWECTELSTGEFHFCTEGAFLLKEYRELAKHYKKKFQVKLTNGTALWTWQNDSVASTVILHTGKKRGLSNAPEIPIDCQNYLMGIDYENICPIRSLDINYQLDAPFVLTSRSDKKVSYQKPHPKGSVIITFRKVKDGIKVSQQLIKDNKKYIVATANFYECETPLNNDGLWEEEVSAKYKGSLLYITGNNVIFIKLAGLWVETTTNWLELYAPKNIKDEYIYYTNCIV